MPDGRRQGLSRLELASEPPVEVEAEVVSVQRDSVFVIFEGDVDLAVRAPQFAGVAIGMRRRAMIRYDAAKPGFVEWRKVVGGGAAGNPDPPGLPLPPPPPGGCPPPGQPLPTSHGPGQENALHRIIEGLLDGRVPRNKENKSIYNSLAYLVRRAEGQGLARGRRKKD